jgi:hypothetical protein
MGREARRLYGATRAAQTPALRRGSDRRDPDLSYDRLYRPERASATRKRCGYVHRALKVKPAYAILGDLFRVVCVDEGTKIKGDESLTSKAVRAIRADYRILATGTPSKTS